MRIREWIKRAAKFCWENLDAILVIVVGFAVAALEVVSDPSKEVVDGAILALLSVTAVVLLRDRAARGKFAAVEQLASDAISDRPYDVVWQINHWDLEDRERSRVMQTEQIRFTRDDVATNFEWSGGDGEVTHTEAKWRRSEGRPWIPAKKIYEFPVRGGTKTIYCFDEEHSRGDMLDWCIERDMAGRFPTDHEGVELQARTKSDYPRVMRITWPADAPPSHVEIRHGNRPARPLTPRKKNGRACVEEKIAEQAIGESVRIDWTW